MRRLVLRNTEFGKFLDAETPLQTEDDVDELCRVLKVYVRQGNSIFLEVWFKKFATKIKDDTASVLAERKTARPTRPKQYS